MGIAATLDVNSVFTLPFTDQRYVVTLGGGFSYVHLKATVEGLPVRTTSPLLEHALAFSASSVISAVHSNIANTIKSNTMMTGSVGKAIRFIKQIGFNYIVSA